MKPIHVNSRKGPLPRTWAQERAEEEYKSGVRKGFAARGLTGRKSK